MCAAINAELDKLDALLHGAEMTRTSATEGGLQGDITPLECCKQVGLGFRVEAG